MNKKFKVNINPEIPSDKEISKSMDFDKLINETSKAYRPIDFRKKMHRKRNFIMLVVCAIALGLAICYGI